MSALKPGAIVAAMLDPYSTRTGIEALARHGSTPSAMEFMPRISRAQSMDVLSSQANLAGYKAVVDAAAHFGQAMPMMMTAAGTVPAARVFIMGVGVAGLQAIATARAARRHRLRRPTCGPPPRSRWHRSAPSSSPWRTRSSSRRRRPPATPSRCRRSTRRSRPSWSPSHIKTQDIVITTALIPGPPGAEADHRRRWSRA